MTVYSSTEGGVANDIVEDAVIKNILVATRDHELSESMNIISFIDLKNQTKLICIFVI